MYLNLEVRITGPFDRERDLEPLRRIAQRLFENHVAFSNLDIEVDITEHAGGTCAQCIDYEPGNRIPDCTPEV